MRTVPRSGVRDGAPAFAAYPSRPLPIVACIRES